MSQPFYESDRLLGSLASEMTEDPERRGIRDPVDRSGIKQTLTAVFQAIFGLKNRRLGLA